MSISFQSIILKFFDNYNLESSLRKNGIYLCRNDGILLYSNGKTAPSLEDASIGALLGGVWQAAEALSAFIPTSNNSADQIYRLSFDDSSQGIYILPIMHQTQKYYLSLSYAKELNPGLLKSNFRKLGDDLSDFLIKKENREKVESKSNKKDTLLFNNITDEEMDSLFSFSGN